MLWTRPARRNTRVEKVIVVAYLFVLKAFDKLKKNANYIFEKMKNEFWLTLCIDYFDYCSTT